MKGRRYKDRITNLPSSLITKILSLLPTKEAVATCFLSTKWKRSWTSITNLDFDDDLIVLGYDVSDYRKFTSFVTRVLLLREGSFLQRLCMKCCHGYDESLVNAWLIAAVHHNIQELDLTININSPGQMLADIFLCRTLVVLKLDGWESCGINMPTSTCLPGLRTLHLNAIQLSDDVSITSLLSGCPMLEELKLCRCVGKYVRVVKITAQFLKILVVDDLVYDYDDEEFDFHPEYQIVIDTPALEYFDFHDYVAKGYNINDMNYLVKASISFEFCLCDEPRVLHSEAITDFLSGISHVQTLVLCEVNNLGACDPGLPKFCSLTYLEINMKVDPHWRILADVLENSPYLENLKFSKRRMYTMKESLETLLSRDVPSCFLSHLKNIEIELSGDDDIEVLEYILKNAQVLEKLTLYKLDAFKVDGKLFEILQSLPRVSPICKVMIL